MAQQPDFLRALEALCAKHHVRLAPTPSGHIGIYYPEPGTPTLLGVVDQTKPTRANAVLERPSGLPAYFATHAEAKAQPGYKGHALARSAAEKLSEQHPGSAIVPIGPRPGAGVRNCGAERGVRGTGCR